MASTYSDTKLQLMATGENNTTWGNVTNQNLLALQELAVGSADVAFASADVTLTLTSTNATQTARNARLNLTGTTAGARNLILGSGCQIFKSYIVNNGTADTVTVKNTTGTGVAVPAGRTMMVFNNGTNVVDVITHLSSLTVAGNSTLTGTLLVNGATNLNSTLNVTNVATFSNAVTINHNLTISRSSAAATANVVGDGQNANANVTSYGAATAPAVGFFRARGSFASPTAVQTGDALGAAAFYGRDSAAADVIGASIRAGVNGTVASGIVPTRLIFATMPTTGTLTDRLVIAESGLFYVNGSTASGQFNIRTASGAQAIVLDNPSGTETLSFTSRLSAGFATGYAANATLSFGTTTANTLQFVTSNTVRYTIAGNGVHCVNDAGPNGVFNVRAASGGWGIVIDNSAGSERIHFTPRNAAGYSRISTQNSVLQVGTDDANGLEFVTSAVYRGGISSDGLNVTFTGVANSTSGAAANVYVDAATGRLYRSTSSERYKDILGDYVPPGSIDDIQPFFFKEKNSPNSPLFAGLSAEQMAALGFEEFVVRNADKQPEALHYDYLSAMFVYYIKELRQRVAALEGK